MILVNPPSPGSGLRALRRLRSGVVTDGPSVAGIASQLNAIAGRRLKVLHSYFGELAGGVGNGYSASEIGWGLFYTSPNCGRVRVRVFLAPGAGTTNASYTFTVGGVAQATRYVAVKGGASYGLSDFDDLQVDVQDFVDGSGNPLAPATQYIVKVQPSANANILGFVIYELPKATLDTATDLCVDPAQFAVNAPIVDQSITDLVEKAWTLHGHGPHHVRYSWLPNSAFDTRQPCPDTVWTNIIKSALGGWSSSAAGFPFWIYGHGRYVSPLVPVTFWCVAKKSDPLAASGDVRFTDDYGTMATISACATTTSFALYTTTGTIDSSLTSSARLCVIEGKCNTVGYNIEVIAAGFFEQR